MDSHILATSMLPETGKRLLFENKQWIEVPDSNSGVYTSGRVTFNLDSVSNSNDSYSNAQQTFIFGIHFSLIFSLLLLIYQNY